MQIIDDVIDIKLQKKINNIILGDHFNWHLNKSNALSVKDKVFNENCDVSPQFVHPIIIEGKPLTNEYYINDFCFLLDIVEETFGLKRENLLRYKANMLLNSNMVNKVHNLPHIDHPFFQTKSVIYYVNESDGDTFIFKESEYSFRDLLNIDVRVSPKMGRALMFDSTKYHTSSNPRKSKYRAILNIVYKNEQ